MPDVTMVRFKAPEQPVKTFFYQRQNGEIFACQNDEAATLMRSSHASFLKQLGASDGTTYYNYLLNCGVKAGERIPLEQAQDMLRAAFNAELEAAKGHFEQPVFHQVIFDSSFPINQRNTFVPPQRD